MRFFLMSGKTKKEEPNNLLEKILLSKINNEKPKILYFPNASNDYLDSENRFVNQMEKLEYELLVYDKQNLNQLIENADILYFGGGITQKIVKELEDVKDLIVNSNKLIAGSSAGANMWFNAGMGDYYSYVNNYHTYNYKMINGYGIINATMCPHYEKEDLIVYNDDLKKYNCDGFGIENDTALYIEDNHFCIYKEDKTRSIYWFKKDENYKMIPLYEGVNYNFME